ncbi:MAG: hypothetical protein M3409_07985, partial [Gemmatimonadota bacterium]|nr:hypothetical protein [Gemmatimonadota bacterium]
FLPLSTSNATLWLGSPEYYNLVRVQGYTYYRVWDEVIYPDDRSVPYPITVEGERYWTARAKTSIRAEPGVYLRFFLEKLGTYWVGDPNADWADTHVFNFRALRGWGYSRAATLQVMAARLLPLVALAAAFLLRRRWRTLLPVYLLLAYSTLLHAATVARVRMSEPFQPFLLILVAGAIVHLAARISRRSPRSPAPDPR